MKTKLQNVTALYSTYPYRNISGKFLFLQYILLKMKPSSFSRMSIVPAVKKHYRLDSTEEFRTRYYISRMGFEEIWREKDRETQSATEGFYMEHDKDIWRQAYLSCYSYMYKKKILHSAHIARQLPKGSRVLDYGCGAGAVAHYLALLGYKVDVADISSKTLKFVLTQFSETFNEIIEVTSPITLPNDEYNLIISLDVLEHTFEPLAIMRSLINSLKVGGICFISFPIEDDFSCAHTRTAQKERAATFAYLAQTCETLVSEKVYRKR